MKKAYIKRIIAVCLFLVMISALTLVCAGAEEEYIPIEWTMDENVEYIYGDEKRYDRYYVNGLFYGDARVRYFFINEVEFDGRFCQVYGESLDPHIVSVMKGDGYSFIFTDDEGRKILDDLVVARDCIYYLEKFNISMYTVIDADFVQKLDSEYMSQKSGKKVTVKANELSEAEVLEITVHDRTESKAYQHGAVYIMPNGIYYYLLFDALDNSHFDADGYFSYRSGSVEVVKLDESVINELNQKNLEMIHKENNSIYEDFIVEGIYDENGNYIVEDVPVYSDFNITFFWIGFFLIGFVVPAVPTVFGFILPNTKKCRNNKGWYALAGFGLVWMLSALGIMLILML